MSPSNYYIKYQDSTIYITKEEYCDIVKFRQEKIKEKQLEELTKLCGNKI